MALITNIIGYYKFDENTGTTVGDATTSANNGTWNGTLGSQWTTGIINSGGNFNGTNNYVLCKSGTILAGQTNFSISAWVNTSTTPGNNGAAIYAERAGSGNDIVKMEVGGNINVGSLRFTYRDDAGTLNQNDTGANIINNGSWNHVVITKSGTAVVLYINAVSRATPTLTATNNMTNAGIEARIGGDKGDATVYYTGKIDEVTLWTRAISQVEVTALYNSGTAIQFGVPPFTIRSSPRITEIKKQWFQVRVLNAKPTTPLGELQMTYYKSVSANPIPAGVTTLDEAEVTWLRNIIVANGGTPTKAVSGGQLWREVLAAFGIQAGFSRKDAERLFYLNVTTNP